MLHTDPYSSEHWTALLYPNGMVSSCLVNTASVSITMKHRVLAYSVYLESFRDLCPLLLRQMNIQGMSAQGIPGMKQLWEWCLIMMEILSFSLMVCGVTVSTYSVKNCSLGKSKPLKAFGDFKTGTMNFLSFFFLWQELNYSTTSQGWEEREVGQKQSEVVLLGAFPGESTTSEPGVMLF